MRLIRDNPKNASAIILFYENNILLQKRDKYKKIFYPGYWSLFGGAKNKYEDYKSTAIREIKEEIGINLEREKLKYFFQFGIEFPASKKPNFIKRYFFTYEIENFKLFKDNITLNEGSSWNFFSKKQYSTISIAPYDKFALDIFYDTRN